MDLDSSVNLRAPFLGFAAGAVLLGVTILQAWQYYINYWHDSKSRKIIFGTSCAHVLSLLLPSHQYMIPESDTDDVFMRASQPARRLTFCVLFDDDVLDIYEYTEEFEVGYDVGRAFMWSILLKALATVKVLLMVLVQGYYLHLIWVLAGSLVMKIELSFSVFAFAYALGIAATFLTFLERISNVSDFPISFERMIYIGFGSSAMIDCGISIIMSLILFKNSTSISKRSNGVVTYMVVFFAATGVLTALAAIATVGLYTANRSSVLYLGIEFSVSRLYANSILALFNAKSSFKKRLEGSGDFYIPSALVFGDNAVNISLPQSPVETKEIAASP
ncbi:hypothetical protein D9613_006481 [Agrocybe pediades]|uniref:DUF6534 domain-containing protein n=1 Tax=Agrocybe pediades TaxID=84607 RepID=A0A8H4QGJ0_9AGAR|nr:hypothetical protein D9613_006481 [Agrocybe pediades]